MSLHKHYMKSVFYLALILHQINFESDKEAQPDYNTNGNKKLSLCIQHLTAKRSHPTQASRNEQWRQSAFTVQMRIKNKIIICKNPETTTKKPLPESRVN